MEKFAGTIAACGLLFLPVAVLGTLGYCLYDLLKRKP